MEMNVNSQNVMNRINNEKKDAMYLKQNEDRTYEFINSFDLIYSDISTSIRNSLHEKLNEIESSNETQEKDIVSLMIIAYDCKKELDTLLSEANSLSITNDDKSISGSFHSSTTNEDYALMPNNTNKKINPVFNAIGRFYSSTDKKSKDLGGSIKPKALVTEKEKENNTVYYSVNNNYYKTIFTQAYNTEHKDKESRPNSYTEKIKLQADNIKAGDSLFNIIQTVKQSKSKNYFTCAKNNKNLPEKEIDKENLNLPFTFKTKRKPPSEGNFSNSTTSANSKPTRTNSDKIENLFRMRNKNFETKNLKSEKLTLQLRASLTPQIYKDSKIRKEENKPMKIIKKLFCDKKSSKVFSEENEKNIVDIKNSSNENILKMAKEFDLIEHIQIDLFSNATPVSIIKKPKDLFTNIKNENIILKLFDYCNTKSEKIKMKNISIITRNKFFEYEVNNLNDIIEIKKREENPLNKLKITDKDIFSKKFILAEFYNNYQDEFKNSLKQDGFRNFLLFINSILSLEKINGEAISSSIQNEDRVDEDAIQKLIMQIESNLNNDRNIYSKYKEIINNLKNKKELCSNFKEIKQITNGKFFLDIIEFLTCQESNKESSELDVLIELIEGVNKLLEDEKINFELGIDIEILNHRKDLLFYYKENL